MLQHHLAPHSQVGADPHTIPHYLWSEWEGELNRNIIQLVQVRENLIDAIWKDRPIPVLKPIEVHPVRYAGVTWQKKIENLRSELITSRCDAIIVTSLTEIAYLLNLRSNDLPHMPVFKVKLLARKISWDSQFY